MINWQESPVMKTMDSLRESCVPGDNGTHVPETMISWSEPLVQETRVSWMESPVMKKRGGEPAWSGRQWWAYSENNPTMISLVAIDPGVNDQLSGTNDPGYNWSANWSRHSWRQWLDAWNQWCRGQWSAERNQWSRRQWSQWSAEWEAVISRVGVAVLRRTLIWSRETDNMGNSCCCYRVEPSKLYITSETRKFDNIVLLFL